MGGSEAEVIHGVEYTAAQFYVNIYILLYLLIVSLGRYVSSTRRDFPVALEQ